MKNYITILFVLLGTHLYAQTFTDIDIDDDSSPGMRQAGWSH